VGQHDRGAARLALEAARATSGTQLELRSILQWKFGWRSRASNAPRRVSTAPRTSTPVRSTDRASDAARGARATSYAALALEPPLGLVSELELEVDESDDDFLSSLFDELSLSVFAGDFASLELDFESLLEGFDEP
jgi:hypothetical protein